MNRAIGILFMGAALGMPVAAAAQDRNAELEARQAARLQEHLLRRGETGEAWGPGQYGQVPPGAYGQVPAGAYGQGSWCPPTGPLNPAAWGRRPGADWCRGPLFPPYGAYYPFPNPYSDWAAIWGRGWLDGAAVPPYHRFQYRFFPETLPDPTRQGYVVPGTPPAVYHGPVQPRHPGVGTACARIELEQVDGGVEAIMVGLPSLGAVTAEALGAVLRERLARGGGVALRGLDGYVYQLPPPESIRRIQTSDC